MIQVTTVIMLIFLYSELIYHFKFVFVSEGRSVEKREEMDLFILSNVGKKVSVQRLKSSALQNKLYHQKENKCINSDLLALFIKECYISLGL